jgi:hypothetical protein
MNDLMIRGRKGGYCYILYKNEKYFPSLIMEASTGMLMLCNLDAFMRFTSDIRDSHLLTEEELLHLTRSALDAIKEIASVRFKYKINALLASTTSRSIAARRMGDCLNAVCGGNYTSRGKTNPNSGNSIKVFIF